MTKQVSQQTFDDVVRENMSEFDMNTEEAVNDAVQQFESQGVNLSTIVKDPSLYSTADGEITQEHPVISAIRELSQALDTVPADNTIINKCLNILKSECDVDLARRCLAGSNGAYPVLLKALSSNQDIPAQVNLVLTALCSLTNGQPDLIDKSGIEVLMSLLKQYKDNAITLLLVVRAIKNNCVKHEGNRQEFIELDLILHLTELLTLHRSNAVLIKEICSCLRSLTVDDDVRVPFGKAHENAKTIVTEGDALKTILHLCEEHQSNTSVLGELFLTLGALAVRDEFCREVMELGGVKLIIGAFQSAISDKSIVHHALAVLKSLAGNDEVKCEIAKLDGVQLVIIAMDRHQTNAQIAEAACRVLATITLRNTDNCAKVIQCQGHQYILQAMKLHPQAVGVQKSACMALRNLVSRTKEFTDAILSLGAESLLNQTLNQHNEAEDEAKAALRDLGCKVELRELWKGQIGTLQ